MRLVLVLRCVGGVGMSSSDFLSKVEGLSLQPEDENHIVFIILVFRVKVGRWPTLLEFKNLYR